MKKTDKQKLFEAFEKVCKIKLLKEERSPKDLLKDHLIELIDFDGFDDLPYESRNAKGDQKIVELFKIYKRERQYEIDRGMSIKKSLIQWLKGMPPAITAIPSYYDEIRNLLYAIGYIDSNEYPKNPEEQDHVDIELDNLFFSEVADIILSTVKRYM